MIQLYAVRLDAARSDIVKDLIRHGVLIPISVKVEAADGDTAGTRVRFDEVVDEDVESDTPEVNWGGSQR